MSTSDAPQRIHIDIPPNEVTLTFDDIFGPLLQTTRQGIGQPGTAMNPELAQQVQTLSSLITQLRDVIEKINQIDPTFLGSNQAPSASP